MIAIKHIDVVPYNVEWPKQYEQEATAISKALGENLIAVHHVGSTAVPGLAAKPTIDMLAMIKDPEKAIKSLETIGFRYRGEYNIPMHYGFSKRGETDVNLHVYEEGHPEIELNLTLRDYLRTHEDTRQEYAALKKSLLEDESSFVRKDSQFAGYTLRKGDFIRKILKEAGYKRLRILKCNDETEWAAAKTLRNKYFFDKIPIDDPYTWTFNHPQHVHFVLYEGTEIIGYAHIQLWPKNRAAIRIIVVDETKRNYGFGAQFMVMIEKWLRHQDYKSIHTESSPAAYGFYKKNGYTDMPFNDPDGYEGDPQDIPTGKML